MNLLLKEIPDAKLLSADQIKILDAPLTKDEMSTALEQCGKGSAPGWDGLPFEYWMNIKNEVVETFTKVYNKITEDNAIT